MDDFRKVLETITAADLPFLNPNSLPPTLNQPSPEPPGATLLPATEATAKPPRKPRQRRCDRKTPDGPVVTPNHTEKTVLAGIVPPVIKDRPSVAGTMTITDNPPTTIPVGPILPEGRVTDTDPTNIRDDSGNADSAYAGPGRRTRTMVPREWPAIGTRLVAEYFGVTYRAEIVVAKKRLKSGKQIRLLDGPAVGKRCNSLSKAMALATARQRREQKLGRRGISNGWQFWLRECPDGKTESLDGMGGRA